MTTKERLDWMLGELADKVPGIVHAIAISPDGLVLGYTPSLSRDQADTLAAAGTGLTNLTGGIARILAAGPVQSTVVDLAHGFLFTMATTSGESVLVQAQEECDPGQITYELALLIERFQELLVTATVPRQPAVPRQPVAPR